MNDCEDPITNGAVHERMKEYVDSGIKDQFGLSFLEFIDQPTSRVRLMVELGKVQKTKDTKIAEAQERAFGNIEK